MTIDNPPEYHLLFEGCTGDVTLKVRLADKERAKVTSFPSKQITWREMLNLFEPDGIPIKRMNFDEWPFELKKIEIEPGERLITLVIQKIR